MTAPALTPDDLRSRALRVADELAADLDNLPALGSISADWQDHIARSRAHGEAAEALAERLRRSHGARIAPVRGGAGGWRVAMLGTTATCTAGLTGALRNWVAGARRRP